MMIGKKQPLDNELALRLLGLLGSSDEFREQFQKAPIDALKTIGYQPPQFGAADMTGRGWMPEPFAGCRVEQLASKEAIQGAQSQLHEVLTQGLAYTSPNLEARAIKGQSSD